MLAPLTTLDRRRTRTASAVDATSSKPAAKTAWVSRIEHSDEPLSRSDGTAHFPTPRFEIFQKRCSTATFPRPNSQSSKVMRGRAAELERENPLVFPQRTSLAARSPTNPPQRAVRDVPVQRGEVGGQIVQSLHRVANQHHVTMRSVRYLYRGGKNAFAAIFREEVGRSRSRVTSSDSCRAFFLPAQSLIPAKAVCPKTHL